MWEHVIQVYIDVVLLLTDKFTWKCVGLIFRYIMYIGSIVRFIVKTRQICDFKSKFYFKFLGKDIAF